jgi:hypothetical protein
LGPGQGLALEQVLAREQALAREQVLEKVTATDLHQRHRHRRIQTTLLRKKAQGKERRRSCGAI